MLALCIFGICVAAYVVVSRQFVMRSFSGMAGSWRGLHSEETEL